MNDFVVVVENVYYDSNSFKSMKEVKSFEEYFSRDETVIRKF